MTGRERILALLSGQEAEHLPCMPMTMMFAADVLEVKYGQYIKDHKIMVEAQVKTASNFGLDYVSAVGSAPETVDLGARIEWYEDQPSALREEDSLFADKSSLARVKAPDRVSGGLIEDLVRGVELLRERVGNELFIEGWIEDLALCQSAASKGISRFQWSASRILSSNSKTDVVVKGV